MTSFGAGALLAGQFRLLEKLGEGGMGELYLAEQLHVERTVVVKLVHAHLAAHHPESVARLKREAKALAQINHPHVVQLFWYGETDDGRPYLVMEYVPGRTLAHELRNEPFPIARALRIALQVSRGLSAAHRQGIVHRDLKPDNIMLTELDGDGDFVKLLDFGIATLNEKDENNLTRTGLVVGTPQYMAPERIEYGQADARTDVYALGLVMYEMLTGDVPFQGETPYGILRKHVSMQPEPPSRIARAVPPALDALVLRCLEKQPIRRYAHGDELEDALLALIDTLGAGANAAPQTRASTLHIATKTASSAARFEGPSPAAHAPVEQRTYGASSPSQHVERKARPDNSEARSALAGLGGVILGSLRLVVPAAFVLCMIYFTTQPAKRRDPSGLFYPLFQLFERGGAPPPPLPPAAPTPSKSSSTPAAAPIAKPQQKPKLKVPERTPLAAKPDLALPRRLAAYAQSCLNTSAGRMYDSFYRYRSWADDSGPTGRERIIYGLYTLSEPVQCARAVAADGAQDELARRARSYLDALTTLHPLIEQADVYYESEGYKDDEMKRGKALHAQLLPAFRATVDAEQALRALLLREGDRRDARYLEQSDVRQRAQHAVRVTGRQLLALGNRPWRQYKQLDRSVFEQAIANLEAALAQLGRGDDTASLRSAATELLIEASKTKRRLGDKPSWSTGDRMNLDNRLSQWMVSGSPAALLRVGETFLSTSNHSELMQSIPIAEPYPLLPFPDP